MVVAIAFIAMLPLYQFISKRILYNNSTEVCGISENKQHLALLMIKGYVKMKECIITISIKCTLNNVWKKGRRKYGTYI